ncbi:hypothetical protein BCR39DRAFT_532323 [Naematelia encephala]|uniref:HD domain-containing protein n=1 Tax=Naematelia encephala TaxID=71784 RepID=A0A1Y2B3B6_9TREE|nr:hypothetical protein BCR39DRAFT_532323 [Naematelia encephala]
MIQIPDYNVPYALSPEQIKSFHEDGFLMLPDVLKPDQVKDMQAWSAEVKGWPNRLGQHMHYEEVRADGTTGLCRTENYVNYHKGFNDLFRGERLTGLLSELMGQRAVLFKEKINYKEAGGSGGFDAHIDASAYNHAGANKHQTFLMAVNDMDMSNGCLEVVPGSHKLTIPLAPNRCIDPTWEAKQTWVPVPMPAGAMLLFGSYLAHRSGANSSPKPRAAIYATYNGISEGDNHDSYYVHRRKLWPPTSERVPGEKYSEGAMIYAYGSPMSGGKESIAETLSSGNKKQTITSTVTDLFHLLEAQGQEGYIGEAISQLEHSLQAAEAARQSGADDATVTASLLHDIGQFLPHANAKEMMHNGESVGRKSHEVVGEVYLRKLGFPEKVCQLVGAHVVAKRYLTATEPGYLEALSSASKASLKYQGGPFSSQQVEEFLQDPLHKEKIALRQWDDQAKRTDIKAPGLQTFRPIVERALDG